jgi:hypothetical protein
VKKAVELREALAALSDYSRTSCQQKLQIQRFFGGYPPVISAGNLHNSHFVHQINHPSKSKLKR